MTAQKLEKKRGDMMQSQNFSFVFCVFFFFFSECGDTKEQINKFPFLHFMKKVLTKEYLEIRILLH